MTAPESDHQDTIAPAGAATGSAGDVAAHFCGHCGSAVEPSRMFCPACGARVAAVTDAIGAGAASPDSTPAPHDALTTPAGTPPPPAAAPPPPPPYVPAASAAYATTLSAPPPPSLASGWDEDQFELTQPAGMARAAYTPVIPNATHRRPRHRVLAVVSTLLLLAVLATTGFWLYSVFAAHEEAAAARYVPANTILFAGIDTIQAAENGHHVSSTDLGTGTGQSDALKQATGLSWNSDILPWLGRDIAFAVFPLVISPTSGPQFPRISYVYLLQSRDDGKAQAAMKKAANFQTQQGNTISTSSYGGFTLYSVTPQGLFGGSSIAPPSGTTIYGPGAPATGPSAPSASATLAGPITGITVTAGNGWALVASDSTAAHAVIDRINAGGNGLDTNAAFQAATRDLPTNRFGTFFVNLRAYETGLLPPDASRPDVPFLDAYPAAGGYAQWTNTGVRGVIELPGQRPASVPDLSGDTTSLARMIPASALVYTGAANFGAAYQAVEALTPAPTDASAPSDAFAQYFGQPASSSVFQQPAAFAVLRQASASQPGQIPGLVGLIRTPDAAAATTALHATAQLQHWTLTPTTVAGTAATAIYAPVPQPDYVTAPAAVPTPPTSSTAQAFPRGATSAPATELVAVAAQVQGTFMVAGSTEDLATVLGVASGAAPSLASSAAFQQLVAAAPTGAATTSYVNLAALVASSSGSSGTNSAAPLLNRATSILVTTVWSQSQIAITADVQLQG